MAVKYLKVLSVLHSIRNTIVFEIKHVAMTIYPPPPKKKNNIAKQFLVDYVHHEYLKIY